MNKILPLLLATVILSMAFQTNVMLPRAKHRIKMAIHYLSADTTEYLYNPEGHVTRIWDSRGNNTTTYEYGKGMIYRRYIDMTKRRAYVDTMLLNDKGLAERITSNNGDIYSEIRRFDADNHIVRSWDPSHKSSVISICKYLNGNQILLTMTNDSGKVMATFTSKYYTDRLNTIGAENLGADFTGSSSVNPVRSTKVQFPGQSPSYSDYYYHYDDRGRISIKASYNGRGRLTDSVGYSYY